MVVIRIVISLLLFSPLVGCLGTDDRPLPPTTLSTLSGAISLQVQVDVQPGSCPNTLNPRSRGVLSIAILGTPDLDVRDIDVSTVLLLVPLQGPTDLSPVRSSIEDVAAPRENSSPCSCPGGPDGYEDLVLKYRTPDFFAVFGSLDTGEERQLVMLGNLIDGTIISGRDCVVGTGSPQDPSYNYEIKFNRGLASGWFGGDDRPGSGPRNVAVGQAVRITRDIVLESFSLGFTTYFDYSASPEQDGHAVTLVLNVRDETGGILQTVSTDVPASYKAGWVSWDGIHLPVEENTLLIFTAYLAEGFTNNLSAAYKADADAGYPDGVSYSKQDMKGTGIEDWTGWAVHPWDCQFWVKGHLSPSPRGLGPSGR